MDDLKNHIAKFLTEFKNGIHALSTSQKDLVHAAILAFTDYMGTKGGQPVERVEGEEAIGSAASIAAEKERRSFHPVRYVHDFHAKFNHPIAPSPTIPDVQLRLLRVRLLMEEAAEFCEASGFPVEVYVKKPDGDIVGVMAAGIEHETPELIDIVEVADGLGDINVVTNGAALVWGIPIAAVDAAINESNMSKLGEDGKPIYDEHGKVQKGPNYKKPDIARVLAQAGWQA